MNKKFNNPKIQKAYDDYKAYVSGDRKTPEAEDITRVFDGKLL